MVMSLAYKITGVYHPAFATGDMDKTILFWRDILGLRVVLSMGDVGARQYFFAISDDTMISFFEWPEVKPAPYKRPGEPVTGPFVFDHLALRVSSREDLGGLQEKLSVAGFPVTDIVDHGFAYSIYSYDPNGVPIEFASPKPGVDLYANPKLADESKSEIAAQGTEPVPGNWPDAGAPPHDPPVVKGEGSELFDGDVS